MQAEKADFEAKLNRTLKRKKWLQANQTLLRTLLSYCSLHGANGGGLASVRMELILLLQELQQEKSQKQLLSPLPFPTTVPLLSACIAQQKTVVTDPISHLQSTAHDLLANIVEQKRPPLPGLADYSVVFLQRDLSVALSACIYQALCDSDLINIKKLATKNKGPSRAILEALSRVSVVYQDSSLMVAHRKSSFGGDASHVDITTEPSKWPGVATLRALIDREKDEETPNLNVLLCEVFVAIYMSLLSYSLAACDAQVLYRLVAQKVGPAYWAKVFGGGAKKMMQIETATPSLLPGDGAIVPTSESVDSGDQGILNTVTSMTKQRVKLNIKVLGVQLGASQDSSGSPSGLGTSMETKPSYREQFIAPESSIVGKLMTKPDVGPNDVEYDSEDDSEVEDAGDDDDEDAFNADDDPFATAAPKTENVEHSDPNSYAWCLMRCAAISIAQNVIEKFIALAGIDFPGNTYYLCIFVFKMAG